MEIVQVIAEEQQRAYVGKAKIGSLHPTIKWLTYHRRRLTEHQYTMSKKTMNTWAVDKRAHGEWRRALHTQRQYRATACRKEEWRKNCVVKEIFPRAPIQYLVNMATWHNLNVYSDGCSRRKHLIIIHQLTKITVPWSPKWIYIQKQTMVQLRY